MIVLCLKLVGFRYSKQSKLVSRDLERESHVTCQVTFHISPVLDKLHRLFLVSNNFRAVKFK